MHKNAQNVEWKTQSKLSYHYICGYSIVKIARLNAFLEIFLTASKPSRTPITAAKRIEKEQKERWKKLQNRKA